MGENQTVSIVIPNYNGKELLKKNLPKVIDAADYFIAVSKQAGRSISYEIIVVDDGSRDGSVEFVKQKKNRLVNSSRNNKPIIKLIKNKKNLGFSSTVNKGVKEVKGEIVILLNTDVAPERGFLQPLLTHFKDEKVFAVGCLDKSIENGKIIERGRGVAWWERGFLVHRRGKVDKTDSFWVSGGSGAFRKSIWQKLGGMDEIYNPFYWEDIDLSYRAQKAGYKVLFEPHSIVVHEHEKGAIKSRFSPFRAKTIAYRNQFYFVWKNITDRKLIASHILWLPYHLLRTLLRCDFSLPISFFLALYNLKKVLISRKKIRQSFQYRDRDIIG